VVAVRNGIGMVIAGGRGVLWGQAGIFALRPAAAIRTAGAAG